VLQAKAQDMLDRMQGKDYDFLPTPVKTRDTWTIAEVGLRHLCLAHL